MSAQIANLGRSQKEIQDEIKRLIQSRSHELDGKKGLSRLWTKLKIHLWANWKAYNPPNTNV